MIAPQTIVGGRYRVVKVLGGGGMKVVYLAEDLRLAARKCALAEMVDSFTTAEAQKQASTAFQREAEMLAHLSNEHIPRVFDFFSQSNHHFLVMEYIDGTTLEDVLKAHGGKLAPDRVVDIALQVLATLDYLHHLEPPVIYRDLKPSNIMVTGDGQAKLIDFGIARHFQPLSNATMIGTQGYAPPEQYRGKVETRSDIYSLGATMHHAISGRDPAAEAPFSFPALQALCPDVNPRLALAIDQALAYDVANRIPDAADFIRRLIQIQQDATAVADSQPSSATIAANHILRTQLKLPLGATPTPLPQAPPAVNVHRPATPAGQFGSVSQSTPAAPTVLSATGEVTCPHCSRLIPADSRFCSYCAADLRLLSSLRPVAKPTDDTVLLSTEPSQQPRSPGLGTYPPVSPPFARARRRNGLRRPFLVFALILAIGVVAAELITFISRSDNPMPSGYNRRPGDAAHAALPPGLGYGDGSAVERSRLAALRANLDRSGFSKVKFRVEGDTLVLYGSVPTDFDRSTVQLICVTTTGVSSLSDEMTVTGEDAAD